MIEQNTSHSIVTISLRLNHAGPMAEKKKKKHKQTEKVFIPWFKQK